MESTQSHETQTDPVAKVDDVISESEIEQIRTATLKSDVDGLHSLLTNLQQNGHSVQTFQLLYGEVNGQVYSLLFVLLLLFLSVGYENGIYPLVCLAAKVPPSAHRLFTRRHRHDHAFT